MKSRKSGSVRKAQARKTVRSKTHRKSVQRPRKRLSTADLQRRLDDRTRELAEARAQQAASSEVLRVIASSPGDLQPVFESILANAMRMCEARFGHIMLYDGESFHAAYLHDVPSVYRELWERGPLRPGPKSGIRRIAETKRFVHIQDLAAEPAYAERDPLRVASVEIAGARTFLVSLRRWGVARCGNARSTAGLCRVLATWTATSGSANCPRSRRRNAANGSHRRCYG